MRPPDFYRRGAYLTPLTIDAMVLSKRVVPGRLVRCAEPDCKALHIFHAPQVFYDQIAQAHLIITDDLDVVLAAADAEQHPISQEQADEEVARRSA